MIFNRGLEGDLHLNVISVSSLGSDSVGPYLNHAYPVIYRPFFRPAAFSVVMPIFWLSDGKGLVNSRVSQEVGPSPRQVGWVLSMGQTTHQKAHRTKAGRGGVRKTCPNILSHVPFPEGLQPKGGFF